jgi:hypothetical protein
VITNVYVDGFNLYYGGCLKGTSHKWLDLDVLCRTLLPNNELQRIRYFTARVKVRVPPGHPQRSNRYKIPTPTAPTRIRTVSGGKAAALHPLPPLAVPLLLKPRCPARGRHAAPGSPASR